MEYSNTIFEFRKAVIKTGITWFVGFSDHSKVGKILGSAWADFDPTTHGNKTNNSYLIDFGIFYKIVDMFRFDHSATGFEWVMQVKNKLTNGAFLQDMIGFNLAHIQNITGNVEGAGFYQGRTITRLYDHHLFKNKYEGISLAILYKE